MSNLSPRDKAALESLFDMSSGYVLNFSDATFGDFFGDGFNIDIHSDKYQRHGTSKAKKLREFWRVEPDNLVGSVILALVEHKEAMRDGAGLNWPDSGSDDTDAQQKKEEELIAKCKDIANRLCSAGPHIQSLKQTVKVFDAKHLTSQIHRMERAVHDDPALAIGTAKELIETCCKTILTERGQAIAANADMSGLTKATIKELKLTPDDVPEASRGSAVTKRLLQNLATIGSGLAELRNLYGTGHGKHGNARGLTARHAKLAVGAAATLATFLFETHRETQGSIAGRTQ